MVHYIGRPILSPVGVLSSRHMFLEIRWGVMVLHKGSAFTSQSAYRAATHSWDTLIESTEPEGFSSTGFHWRLDAHGPRAAFTKKKLVYYDRERFIFLGFLLDYRRFQRKPDLSVLRKKHAAEDLPPTSQNGFSLAL